jgi:glutathione synthase
MDPIDQINIKKDTTFAMMLEAKKRKWDIEYAEIGDLYYQTPEVLIRSKFIDVEDNASKWFRFTTERKAKALSDFDCVIMRKDPPFNMPYIYATYLLEKAERAGAWVVNRPSSLRDCNEKFFTTYFPECCPPTMVSSCKGIIRDFIQEHNECILKPLDSMGGHQVFRASKTEATLSVMLEMLTEQFNTPIMVQKYIPEIKKGDKRILMINGKAFPYGLNRLPKAGETRANLAAGGLAEGFKLTNRDLEICETLSPVLIEKGLIFVGIDVIGNYLTEINVTSPTCAREIEQAFNANVCSDFLDVLESQF